MISTNKDTYRQLLSQHHLPIFYQDWYLDVSCRGSHWVPYMLLDEKDTPLAVWIGNPKKKGTLRTSIHPQLTPYSGLFAIDPLTATEAFQPLLEAVCRDYHIVIQDFHPQSPPLPYCHEKTTFIIPAGTTAEQALGLMKSDYRRKVRQAEKLAVLTETSFTDFRRILEASFAKKGKSNPYPMELFTRLDAACATAGQRCILGINDHSGILQGAAYFMHDRLSWYYMGGASLGIKNGAAYLISQGIQRAMSDQLAFDFEGSTVPSIAQYFKGFGGKQTSYPTMEYTSGPFAALAFRLKKYLS